MNDQIKAESGHIVALADSERLALWQAGDHHPELCDCAGDDWSADGEWCGGLEDTFAAVERLLAARMEALAVEIESNIDWSDGRSSYGDNGGYEHAARIVREVINKERPWRAEFMSTSPGASSPSAGEEPR